jgi:hypothetical protein
MFDMSNENQKNSSENTPEVVQNPKKVIDEAKELADKEKLENKVKEIHNNIRHITQLAVSWFVFFVTINYATMGWLAVGSTPIKPGIIGVIAGAFIVQNIIMNPKIKTGS